MAAEISQGAGRTVGNNSPTAGPEPVAALPTRVAALDPSLAVANRGSTFKDLDDGFKKQFSERYAAVKELLTKVAMNNLGELNDRGRGQLALFDKLGTEARNGIDAKAAQDIFNKLDEMKSWANDILKVRNATRDATIATKPDKALINRADTDSGTLLDMISDLDNYAFKKCDTFTDKFRNYERGIYTAYNPSPSAVEHSPSTSEGWFDKLISWCKGLF